MQTFLAGAFDQLDHLADELLVQELVSQRGDREALRAQVERLASVANELTAAVAEQKQLVDQKMRRRGRQQGLASSDA